MAFRAITLVLVFLLSAALGDVSDPTRAFMANLESTSYDKNIPPEGYRGPGSAIKVLVSAYILDIEKVDDYNLDFNVHMYLRQSWNDSRLKYDMNVDFLSLNTVENIWTPDLFFVEEREGSLHEVVTPNVFIRIKPNGEVFFSSKLNVKLHCPMDLRNYPHDIQKCKFNIESYGFQRKYMELDWLWGAHSDVVASKSITMLEFDLIESVTSTEHEEMSTGVYTRLQITLTFKRKFGFFATRLYVPFIILVFMTSFSLWIRPSERNLRLGLLLVILYLMVTISTSMNNLTPPAPYTKGIDVWIGFCESLVFAAFLEFIVVALIAGKETEEDAKTKNEILLTLDPENKENKLKSPLSKVMNMFDSRRGETQNSLAHRIDKICRLVFPVIFLIFNIIYWSIYCCR